MSAVYSDMYLETRLMMAITIGGCCIWAARGQTRGRRPGLSFKQMTLSLCQSGSAPPRVCPNSSHCIQCLGAGSLKAEWIQIKRGFRFLGSAMSSLAVPKS